MRKIVCPNCAPRFSGPIDPRDAEMGFEKRFVKLVVKKPADHAISINGVKQEQLPSILCDQCGTAIPDGTVGVAVSMWRSGSLGDWEHEFGTVCPM